MHNMQRTPENGSALNGEAKIESVRTLLFYTSIYQQLTLV